MRTLLLLALLAGSGCKKKVAVEKPLPTDVPSETCCCKFTTIGDENPSYEMRGVMECSTSQGECVGEPQCATGDAGAPATP